MDYYGKIMLTQQNEKEKKAIIKRKIKKVREELVMPKDKIIPTRKKLKKKIAKKAIKKMKK